MITRRSFLKAAGAAGAAAFGMAALSACGEGRGAASASASASESSTGSATSSSASSSAGSAASSSASSSAGASSSAAASSSAGASSSAAASSSAGASSLATAGAGSIVVYFSRAGENYGVGTVEQGNTAVLAEMIAEKAGAATFEIIPAQAYPEGYDKCCDVALEEQNAGARPAYTGDVDLSAHQTIYLGYPIWWGDLPMCVYTFLEEHDWAGKEIRPFLTHAGSGAAGTDAKLRSACAGATVGEPLSVAGTTAQNDRAAAEAAVDAWLV